ncbi:MAG: OmpA family protein [Deltaproteobacteria bacterium]|nr:OmpA family protein [Deltaproteobacteria bacterium]
MGTLQPRNNLFLGVVSLLLCQTALAQDDYDAEYDDELAAGEYEYSDAEAAGEVSDETSGEASSELSTEDESDVGWEGEGDVGDEDPDERDELKPWEWGAERHHSNLKGATGLFHIIEAGSDEGGTFGIGFHGAFFKYSDYLYRDDENSYMWGSLNLRVTPIEHLEIYAGFQSQANYNDANYPELFQTLGDFQLGLKGYLSPVDWWTLGALFGISFMNPVGEVSVSLEGTSFDIGLLNTFDFVEINKNAPIRAHLNIGYFFDRSANLTADIEKVRGGCGTDENNDGYADFEGCLNPIERTALNINRNDQMHIGIGVDALLPYVTPLVEYVMEIPVNRQGFTCPENIPGNPDSCMQREGSKAMRQWVTLGARVLPPIGGLAIDVGVDIGVTGYAPSVHELAAQAPYRVIFGLSYNIDPFPNDPLPPPLEDLPPLSPEPEPPKVVVAGLVHDEADPGKVVQGAVITYLGHQLNPQVSDMNGRFLSYSMPPGPLTISVSAKGYQDGSFKVEIPDQALQPQDDPFADGSAEGEAAPEGGEPPADEGLAPIDEPAPEEMPEILEIKLDCPLKAIPQKATLVVSVTDPDGNPVSGADVKLEGPTAGGATTGSDGKLEREIDPGSYSLRVEKDEYFKKVRSFEAAVDTRSEIEVQLTRKPEKSSVIIRKKRIVIKKKIHFETNSDEIKRNSFPLMDEIADVLLSHSELKLIEIQGHTDNRGKAAYNLDLSERRARSVRRYIVEAGVAPTRLEAKGFGSKKQIAPNITAQGRARNRRVEFHIVERVD